MPRSIDGRINRSIESIVTPHTPGSACLDSWVRSMLFPNQEFTGNGLYGPPLSLPPQHRQSQVSKPGKLHNPPCQPHPQKRHIRGLHITPGHPTAACCRARHGMLGGSDPLRPGVGAAGVGRGQGGRAAAEGSKAVAVLEGAVRGAGEGCGCVGMGWVWVCFGWRYLVGCWGWFISVCVHKGLMDGWMDVHNHPAEEPVDRSTT